MIDGDKAAVYSRSLFVENKLKVKVEASWMLYSFFVSLRSFLVSPKAVCY